MSTGDFGKRRNDLALFILSVIALGVLFNLIANLFERFIPKISFLHIIGLSSVAIATAILIGFYVISPFKEIREETKCFFFHDLEKGSPIEIWKPTTPPSKGKPYYFTFYAHQAFAELYNSGQRDILKTEGVPRHFSDFMICAIICWLKNLAVRRIGTLEDQPTSSTFWKVWIERGGKDQQIRDEEIKSELEKFGNVFADKLLLELAGFYIRLPENWTFDVKKDKVIIKNHACMPFLTVEVGFRDSQWMRQLPQSVMSLLQISSIPSVLPYATVETRIFFYAKFRKWAIFSRNADMFHLFVKEMVQHLKQFYSWPQYENDLKDYFYWKHVSDGH